MPVTEPLQFSVLIRSLRHKLNLPQEKFAAQLGASFRTVNRWENGHVTPSSMALKLIEDRLRKMGEPGKELLRAYFLTEQNHDD